MVSAFDITYHVLPETWYASLGFLSGPLHLRKPRILSPLRSLHVRNEVDLVPLACEDGATDKTDLVLCVTQCVS